MSHGRPITNNYVTSMQVTAQSELPVIRSSGSNPEHIN